MNFNKAFLRSTSSVLAASTETQVGAANQAAPCLLREANIAHLPEPVQRYVRLSGAINSPCIRNFRIRMRGRIRSDARARWMPFTAQQVSSVAPPARLFLMDAKMFGVPVQAYHEFVGSSATMRVRLASMFDIVDAKGDAMDQGETVTLLNDLCVLAPGALAVSDIAWTAIDAHHAGARFTHAGHSVSATLSFDALGHLTDFVSDDRLRASRDGKSFTSTRWSTPLRDFRMFGSHQLAGYGEGRWHPDDAGFTYVQMEIVSVEYNVGESTGL